MAYVNIALSSEAYERLKLLKKEKESFSEEVMRMTSAPKLWELGGILSEREAEEIEKGVALVRKNFKVRQWQ